MKNLIRPKINDATTTVNSSQAKFEFTKPINLKAPLLQPDKIGPRPVTKLQKRMANAVQFS